MNTLRALGLASSLAGLIVLFSCSDDDDNSAPPAACANPGGAVSGQADTHCGSDVVTVDPATCHEVEDDGGMTNAARTSLHVAFHEDAGEDGGDPGSDDYGDTLSNAEGDDDDCKYHVKWSSSPVCANNEVTFTLTLTNKSDGSPVHGSPIRVEAYLDSTHPAPNTNQTWTETGDGVYQVGPIKFDAPGNWTSRFHFHEECNDSEESPHGHAAFFVAVP